MEISFAFEKQQKKTSTMAVRKKLINLAFMSDLLPILCWIAYCCAIVSLPLFNTAAVDISKSQFHKWPEARYCSKYDARDQLQSIREKRFLFGNFVGIYYIIFVVRSIVSSCLCLFNSSSMRFQRILIPISDTRHSHSCSIHRSEQWKLQKVD